MTCTTTGSTRTPTIGTRMALLLAFVSAAVVANVYYAQPLLDDLGAQLHMTPAALGWVTTATQAGYLIGLVLVVPLGDRFDRRRMILAQLVVTAIGLVGAAAAPSAWVFLACSAVFGAASTAVQVITAFAAAASPADRRGRTVGVVTSGVVVGILLARSVSGLIADLWGWRQVFGIAALVMFAVTAWLARCLPPDTIAKDVVPFRRSALSVIALSVRDRTFRVRSLIGGLMFASFGAAWGAIALPLATDPWQLTPAQIGIFGIVGAAGALGAARAGRWADRGRAQPATGVLLLALLMAWLAIAQTPNSLVLLAIGLLVLDFAGQAVHVINQHLIVESDPAATSRLIGGYMVYYSIGTGTGALAATYAYARGGWPQASAIGAAFAAAAFLVWAADGLLKRRSAATTYAPRTPRTHHR